MLLPIGFFNIFFFGRWFVGGDVGGGVRGSVGGIVVCGVVDCVVDGGIGVVDGGRLWVGIIVGGVGGDRCNVMFS